MNPSKPRMTLRSEDELHQALLLRYGASLLKVRASPPLREGDFLEMRLELSSLDTVVQGLVEVRKASPARGDQQHALLRIAHMRPSSRALLEEWYDVTLHPSAESPEDVPGSGVAPRAPRSAGPERERDVLMSVSTPLRAGAGRAAIRAVFRSASATRRQEREQAGEALPKVQLELETSPPRLALTYRLDTWQRDWRDWLSKALLYVHHSPPFPRMDSELAVHLRCPPLLDLHCVGRVINVHDSGFGLLLDARMDHIDRELPGLCDERGKSADPDEQRFWARMFEQVDPTGPLELVLRVQPDPLEPLAGLSQEQREAMGNLLEWETDGDLLTDELTLLLEGSDWSWPELENLVHGSPDPTQEAATTIALAALTRRQAVGRVREANRRGFHLRLQPGDVGCSDRCQEQAGRVLSPLALAHVGLPPYHLGCCCQLVLAPPPLGHRRARR